MTTSAARTAAMRDVDRGAERAEAVRVRRRDVDERDVERELPRANSCGMSDRKTGM